MSALAVPTRRGSSVWTLAEVIRVLYSRKPIPRVVVVCPEDFYRIWVATKHDCHKGDMVEVAGILFISDNTELLDYGGKPLLDQAKS